MLINLIDLVYFIYVSDGISPAFITYEIWPAPITIRHRVSRAIINDTCETVHETTCYERCRWSLTKPFPADNLKTFTTKIQLEIWVIKRRETIFDISTFPNWHQLKPNTHLYNINLEMAWDSKPFTNNSFGAIVPQRNTSFFRSPEIIINQCWYRKLYIRRCRTPV